MAKYGNSSYLELPKKIFTDEYKGLSTNAKWLYVVLKELEHRLTGKGPDNSFFSERQEFIRVQRNKTDRTQGGQKRTHRKRANRNVAKHTRNRWKAVKKAHNKLSHNVARKRREQDKKYGSRTEAKSGVVLLLFFPPAASRSQSKSLNRGYTRRKKDILEYWGISGEKKAGDTKKTMVSAEKNTHKPRHREEKPCTDSISAPDLP